MVLAVTADLRLLQRAESSFVRAGAAVGADIVPYHSLFLPGEQYPDSEIVGELRRREIGAILVVADGTTDAPTTIATAHAIPLCYMTVGGQCVSGSTVVVGNRRQQQDKFTIVSRVLDVASGRIVWVGSTRIQRNGARDSGLISGLAKDVVRTLVQDSVLHPRSPAPNERCRRQPTPRCRKKSTVLSGAR